MLFFILSPKIFFSQFGSPLMTECHPSSLKYQIQNSWKLSIRINPINRIIPDIPIQIHITTIEPDGVFLEEPTQLMRIITVPVIIQVDLGDVFPSGEEETVANCGRIQNSES